MTDPTQPSIDAAGWTAVDDAQSGAEGWYLSTCYGCAEGGARGAALRIEKRDEVDTFAGDEDAWTHVLRRAAEGARMHRRALLAIRTDNPTEYALLLDHARKIGLTFIDVDSVPA